MSYLELHNKARAEVGVHPLRWSESLAQQARAFALEVASTNRWEHSAIDSRFGQGENMFRSSAHLSERQAAVQACTSWENEKSMFIPGTKYPYESSSGVVGHYTQMVWHATTEMGAGYATSEHGTFVIARYSPRGNIKGQSPYQPGSESSVRTHTVKKGDTLFEIAEAFYGDGNRYHVIFEANRSILDNPDEIRIGQVLRIP